MEQLTIQTIDPGSPKARRLIEELDNYLSSLYPAESNHLLSVESLRLPNVTFLVALFNREIVGCGAFVNHYGKYAEIKRMFVLSDLRHKGIGCRILKELENIAQLDGLRVARLETGVYQPEALRLYERSGYQRRNPFAQYKNDPLSVFMEKELEHPNTDNIFGRFA
jgi:GNAT superfamily N-acetyltransferase